MSILWIPDIEVPAASLLRRDWFKRPGPFLGITPPAGAKYLRALAQGCGGDGPTAIGGGGAFARTRKLTDASWTYSVQVGDTSTASSAGDSAVWKGAAGSGELIVYADRGRGDGTNGKASLSFGDVKRDGAAGLGDGGLPGGDSADFASLGFDGWGGKLNQAPGIFGGGGFLFPKWDSSGFRGYSATAVGGMGRVCLEWWDADPGY
jgi:hypothetical protein